MTCGRRALSPTYGVAVAAAISLAGFVATATASSAQADVVYTPAQAVRGEALYLQECAACHGRDLQAVTEFGAPPLAGEEFLRKWQGKTVGTLFDLTRATMPLDSPGRLSRRQYSDILAHVLKTNGFTAGDRELSDDSSVLKTIVISASPENP